MKESLLCRELFERYDPGQTRMILTSGSLTKPGPAATWTILLQGCFPTMETAANKHVTQ